MEKTNPNLFLLEGEAEGAPGLLGSRRHWQPVAAERASFSLKPILSWEAGCTQIPAASTDNRCRTG